MIQFVQIDLEGFGSIESKLSYKLNNPGTTLLLGPNGAGKSTIPNGILWALFGKLIGKDQVTTWEDKRSEDYAGAKVTIYFKSGKDKIKVIRCQDYQKKVSGSKGGNRLLVYCNGKYLEEYRNKRDGQKKLGEYLGFTFEVFINSIILGQNLTRILDSTGERQKAVMDEAFSTMYIQRAKDLAKADLIKEREHFNKLSMNAQAHENALEVIQEAYRSQKESVAVFNELKQSQLDRINENIKSAKHTIKVNSSDVMKLTEAKGEKLHLEKSLNFLLPNLDAYVKEENKAFQLGLQADAIAGDVQTYQARKKSYVKEMAKPTKICPTCGSEKGSPKKILADLKDKIAHTNAQLKESEIKLAKIKNELIEINSSLLILAKSRDKITKLKKSLESVESDLRKLASSNARAIEVKRSLREYKADLEELKAKKPDRQRVDNLYKSLKHKKKEVKLAKPILEKQQELVNELEWLIKDPLSSKGLKTYIFNDLLYRVSQRASYYAQYSGVDISFSVDLESASKPLVTMVSIDGTPRNYKALSGGQKQLANITASFAIHDEISEAKKVNLIFLDEIFENLDKSNIQVVSDLINLRSEKQSVHLITHRAEFNLYNAKTIELGMDSEKRTKISQR